MTLTEQYTQLHRTFIAVGANEDVTPYAARVLLAVAELGLGDDVRTDVLEDALGNEASSTRRALVELYASGHLVGVGPHDGPRRPGTRTQVSLTQRGRDAVASILDRASEYALTAAA